VLTELHNNGIGYAIDNGPSSSCLPVRVVGRMVVGSMQRLGCQTIYFARPQQHPTMVCMEDMEDMEARKWDEVGSFQVV
jgi:hypothetical protein